MGVTPSVFGLAESKVWPLPRPPVIRGSVRRRLLILVVKAVIVTTMDGAIFRKPPSKDVSGKGLKSPWMGRRRYFA
jgi:hypothetical protein